MGSAAGNLMRLATEWLGSGPTRRWAPPKRNVEHLTLLELVEAVADTTEDDAEVVATVTHMLRSGAVTLEGNFRGEPTSQFSE
jgi:hypothetical protein